MQLFNNYRNTARICSGLATLLMVLSLFAVTALAVEEGKLSVTAEGVTASRAVFHMHPDEKIRNGDYIAKQMVHPDYWHYSLYSKDFALAMEVIRTFRQTICYYVNARTKHMDEILEAAGKNGIKSRW